MSSYTLPTQRPDTGIVEHAEWIDDYFGHRHYGVRFPSDGKVFRADEYVWENDAEKNVRVPHHKGGATTVEATEAGKRIVTNVTPRTIWDALRHGTGTAEILEHVPDEFYKWVLEWKNKLTTQYKEIELECARCHTIIKELPTRREQETEILYASSALRNCHSGVLFAMLDGKAYDQLIWRHLKPTAEDAFTQEI